jgi:adenosylcobyric acid synthase
MKAKCVMVLGTTSGAGKSWLATALCRHYARQGFSVAPFKAQNMSNNARVVEGGEIGTAQYLQALAARARPEVRMNPVLLKPEKDTGSRVVLLGQEDARLSRMPWRRRCQAVWPAVAAAFDALRSPPQVVVLEGAGSPAEPNLAASDIVNLRMARHAGARCLLVSDIDRGGAFAHLYGTHQLLGRADRSRIDGFVLNKFRGDPALLAPAPAMLEGLTGIPTVATIPMWTEHGLPEEDGFFERPAPRPAGGARTLSVAIVSYPRLSNLDEFQPLAGVPGLRLSWVRRPAELEAVDWIILPGSKHTSSDLRWLRAQGLDRAVASHAASGRPVLGICGGLQMLGERLVDPHRLDGEGRGLGLLPLETTFEKKKTLARTEATFRPLRGPWAALSRITLEGYEIRHGRTEEVATGRRISRVALPRGLGWQNHRGNVLGLYLHGMFEDRRVLEALFGVAPPSLDAVFDGLADHVARHFRRGVLSSLVR